MRMVLSGFGLLAVALWLFTRGDTGALVGGLLGIAAVFLIFLGAADA